MEANRKGVDPSDQELEGSTIAGEISSVNHTTPCPSAPPDQRRESKRASDNRSKMKRKQKEAEMMRLLGKQEIYSRELDLENGRLKRLRVQKKALVDEENKKILCQLEKMINFTGETSPGQDGLNGLFFEMNQAPITSNADTISGENASMNLQTLPRSAQPAGSSGLPDDKQARKRISGKIYRDTRRCMLEAAAARINELKEKNANMETDNAVLEAERIQLIEHLIQLRDIKKMISKISQQENGFVDLTNYDQGSTLNTQLPFDVTGFGTGETGWPVHHPPVYQSGTTMGSGGLAVEDSPGLPQSELSQGWTHLPWGMTPDNTFNTWEAGPPVHHPPVYPSGTTIRPEGPVIEYPPELSQSHLPQGWPHENNFEQPDSTYGDQFIEVSGCSNNIDGSYI